MVGVAVAFLFGLAYGSFLNVVILRFDDWMAIVNKPSHCPKCKNNLKWYDLVPVFSFIFLGGKCRYCTKPISWQYPLIEVTVACLVAASYFWLFIANDLVLYQSAFGLVALVVAIGAMMTIFMHDLKEMMVPDVMSNLLIIAAVIYALIVHQDTLGTIYSALVGFLPIMLLVYPSRGKWMGEGDVKIAGALAILVGWPSAVVFILLSFLLGGAFGTMVLLAKKGGLKTALPFGPFLIIAAIIALFWGEALTIWYLGSIGYGYY